MALSFSRELFVVSCFWTCDFRTKFASPNPRVNYSALTASVVFSGRVVSEDSRSSYSWRVFELGRVISFTTARPLDHHSTIGHVYSKSMD